MRGFTSTLPVKDVEESEVNDEFMINPTKSPKPVTGTQTQTQTTTSKSASVPIASPINRSGRPTTPVVEQR